MNWLLIVCLADNYGGCLTRGGVTVTQVTEQQCLAGQHLYQLTRTLRGWCMKPDGSLSTVRVQ